MTVPERLSALRAEMCARGIDAYLIPSDDYHCSEYVGDYFKARAFISGFTGSAGTMLVLQDEAGLWTDGRYFLQAADQMNGSGITLYKMGEPGVPTLVEFLKSKLSAGQTLGFDGRTLSATYVADLTAALPGVSFWHEGDLVGNIWADRPAMRHTPVKILSQEICGKSAAEKLQDVRAKMQEKQADLFVLAMLDDIAWLLNIRADDVHCNPVVLAYAVLSREQVWLFADSASFDAQALAYLSGLGVTLLPYDGVAGFLRAHAAGKTVLLSRVSVNYEIASSVQDAKQVIDQQNMTVPMKAQKNETEAANMVQAHIKDGIAYTKFIYWLKKNAGKLPMTELSCCDYLEKMRREQPGYWGISFDTICGYDWHGAIVHYDPTEETNIPVEARSFLLVDAGGHYDEGTTDITRTIAMGPVDAEQKTYYTAVLRGNLNLGAAKFHEGAAGCNLDYLARRPLWELGVDYNHGTGHGVGYLLSVHEGPQSIHYRRSSAPFCENMITSDEPGVYFEGKYGIRLENLVICKKAEKTAYGQFLRFEYLTLVPFDLDAVDPAQMTAEERALLNAYHKRVFETIAPHLTQEETAWLKEATRAI